MHVMVLAVNPSMGKDLGEFQIYESIWFRGFFIIYIFSFIVFGLSLDWSDGLAGEFEKYLYTNQ